MFKIARRIANKKRQNHEPFFFDFRILTNGDGVDSTYELQRKPSNGTQWNPHSTHNSVSAAQMAVNAEMGEEIVITRWGHLLLDRQELKSAMEMKQNDFLNDVFQIAGDALNNHMEVVLEDKQNGTTDLVDAGHLAELRKTYLKLTTEN